MVKTGVRDEMASGVGLHFDTAARDFSLSYHLSIQRV